MCLVLFHMFRFCFVSVEKLEETVEKLGYGVDHVPAFGNCMFEALSRQFSRFGKDISQQQIRSDVVAFMKEHQEVCSLPFSG